MKSPKAIHENIPLTLLYYPMTHKKDGDKNHTSDSTHFSCSQMHNFSSEINTIAKETG